MHLFRVIVPVEDVERAAAFYARLLGVDGERVTSGRHYFDCEGTILACWDPVADGDLVFPAQTAGTCTWPPLRTSRPSGRGSWPTERYSTRNAVRSQDSRGVIVVLRERSVGQPVLRRSPWI